MAASSSHLTKTINRHKLLTLSLLLLSLLCFLLFNRRALDPKLRDLALTSPLLFQDESDDTRQPISVSPNLEQSADRNATAAPKLSEPDSQEDRNVEETQPVSSNSDLDDETTHKTSDPESEDDSGERKDEPGSSNEDNEVPISSNSNLDGEAPQETSEPELSNEDKIALIASEPDSDEKNSTKLGKTGVKVESLKEAASSYTGSGGFVDNAVAEKLRNCDMYRGKWVKDEGYPLYRAGSCPYVDEGFDCQNNGRPDSAYTQWRWKPDGCELPRFSLSCGFNK